MYNTIFINFNVLCDKTIQIESVKKKQSIKTISSKKNQKEFKIFLNNIKHFRMIKTRIKIKIIFKIKTKKMIAKMVQKNFLPPKTIHRIAAYGPECDER